MYILSRENQRRKKSENKTNSFCSCLSEPLHRLIDSVEYAFSDSMSCFSYIEAFLANKFLGLLRVTRHYYHAGFVTLSISIRRSVITIPSLSQV